MQKLLKALLFISLNSFNIDSYTHSLIVGTKSSGRWNSWILKIQFAKTDFETKLKFLIKELFLDNLYVTRHPHLDVITLHVALDSQINDCKQFLYVQFCTINLNPELRFGIMNWIS